MPWCRSLNTIFIAGSTDDFVDCLLPSYTSYRSSGLLWFLFLVIVHVLLLNLVLDTLVAAYTKYSEEQEEVVTSLKVQGILNVFRTVSRVTDSRVITRQTFMDFCEDLESFQKGFSRAFRCDLGHSSFSQARLGRFSARFLGVSSFAEEFSKSPGARSLAGDTADIMFTTMAAWDSEDVRFPFVFGRFARDSGLKRPKKGR